MTTQQKSRSYTAKNVAKYIIYLGSQITIGDNQEKEGVTNLKLQKLLYFTQAYFLVKKDRLAFSDKIEAWDYGPVVPSVYKEYKTYKSTPVITPKDTSSLSEEDKKIVDKIWAAFGGYSAGRLVEITHAHSPWQDANKTTSKEITTKTLKEYYSPIFK